MSEARIASNSKDEKKKEVALVAAGMLLASGLESLNSFVDSAIAVREHTSHEGAPPLKMTRASRNDRLTALEVRFGFNRADLPGWKAVKEANDQANALKHRIGLTWRRRTSTALSIESSVDPTLESLLPQIDDVYEWICAFTDKTESVSVA